MHITHNIQDTIALVAGHPGHVMTRFSCPVEVGALLNSRFLGFVERMKFRGIPLFLEKQGGWIVKSYVIHLDGCTSEQALEFLEGLREFGL